MNWEWLFSEGLIEGEIGYYTGDPSSSDVNHAVVTAYTDADDAQRKKLVDMLWESGKLEGEKEYWYKNRSAEVQDIAAAYSGVRVDDDGGLVGTGVEGGDPRFGIAGGAKLWKNTTTGESFIVYVVPGTEDDPVYMRWLVPSEEDVQSFFGPEQPVVYEKRISGDNPLWADTVDFGSSDDITNTATSPFDSWASTLEVESVSQPWLLDDDYQQLFAMAMIEGRELSEGEIRSTSYWRDHTKAQRDWMTLHHGDPSEAARRIDDNRLRQENLFRDAGLTGFDEGITNFFADRVTKGEWSVDKAYHELEKLSDPYFSDEPLDADLMVYIQDTGLEFGQTTDETDTIRKLVGQWLGPNFGNWNEATINQWAGRLRNENDAEIALIETLKDQKEAMFPNYHREADFNTIAAPWRSFANSIWGVAPQDDDEILQQVIINNDADSAGALLRSTGLERGYDRVVNDIDSSLRAGMGNNVRGSV